MTDLLRLAIDAARAAGRLLSDMDPAALMVRSKTHAADLVSAADVQAQELIAARLQQERPLDAMLGEERLDIPGSSGYRWIIDPLDGTANFLRGIPHWAVSVACEDHYGPLAAVVYDVPRDELHVAERGAGAFVNGLSCKPTADVPLSEAMVCGCFEHTALLTSLAGHARSGGSAALDLAWVASGRCDAFFHDGPLGEWDIAAGRLLCQEAGLQLSEFISPDLERPLLVAGRRGLLSEILADGALYGRTQPTTLDTRESG